MRDPDTMNPVFTSIFILTNSKDYFWGNAVWHANERKLSISTYGLVEGDSVGCCITRDGDLEVYINGQYRAVGWRNVPVNKPLWGVVWMHGKNRTIQSEFYCGELYSYNVYSVSHSCACACMYISICSLLIMLKPVILQSHSVM